MLDSCDLVAFVATAKPAEARRFYEGVLGLRFVGEDPFGLTFDANGTEVRMPKLEAVTPVPFTVLGWKVPDVSDAIRELSGRGVTFERFPGMEQEEDGAWRAPGGGKVAWFKDPDGNVLSVSGG